MQNKTDIILEILIAAAKADWFYDESHPAGFTDEECSEMCDTWQFLAENLSGDEYDDALEHLSGSCDHN